MTPSQPWLNQPFLRKDQTYKITIHVPLTRVKGVPPTRTQTDWAHLRSYRGYRPTEFESNPFIGLARTLD